MDGRRRLNPWTPACHAQPTFNINPRTRTSNQTSAQPMHIHTDINRAKPAADSNADGTTTAAATAAGGSSDHGAAGVAAGGVAGAACRPAASESGCVRA